MADPSNHEDPLAKLIKRGHRARPEPSPSPSLPSPPPNEDKKIFGLTQREIAVVIRTVVVMGLIAMVIILLSAPRDSTPPSPTPPPPIVLSRGEYDELATHYALQPLDTGDLGLMLQEYQAKLGESSRHLNELGMTKDHFRPFVWTNLPMRNITRDLKKSTTHRGYVTGGFANREGGDFHDETLALMMEAGHVTLSRMFADGRLTAQLMGYDESEMSVRVYRYGSYWRVPDLSERSVIAYVPYTALYHLARSLRETGRQCTCGVHLGILRNLAIVTSNARIEIYVEPDVKEGSSGATNAFADAAHVMRGLNGKLQVENPLTAALAVAETAVLEHLQLADESIRIRSDVIVESYALKGDDPAAQLHLQNLKDIKRVDGTSATCVQYCGILQERIIEKYPTSFWP